MRQFDRNTYRGLKASFRRLVNSFGKFEVAASETRVNQVSLSNYCSLNTEQEKCHAPMDVMIDLIKASGDFSVLEYLASVFDKELVDRPTGERGARSAKANAVIKEMAEAIAAATGDDRSAMLKEAREAVQAGMDLIASLESEEVEGR